MTEPRKPTPGRRRSARPPSKRHCVFREPLIRTDVDPRVKVMWERATSKPAPFGRLRKVFQDEHCARVNPYTGSECPYTKEECALAFLQAVQNSLMPWIEDPAAYFVKVAASGGARRADNKPLAREKHLDPQGPGQPVPASPGDRAGHAGNEGGWTAERDRLRGARRRPVAIGDVLGALHIGARQGRAADGSEGVE